MNNSEENCTFWKLLLKNICCYCPGDTHCWWKVHVHIYAYVTLIESLHLIISDIITWCGLENSDIWDSSLMTESGCGWGHRMINCVNNIWLKSDDKLEKASIIISAASLVAYLCIITDRDTYKCIQIHCKYLYRTMQI
jgi:hypothetical protein